MTFKNPYFWKMIYQLYYNIRGTYSNGELIIIDQEFEAICSNHSDATNKAKAAAVDHQAKLIAQGHNAETIHFGYGGPPA